MGKGRIFFFAITILIIIFLGFFVHINTNGRVQDFVAGQFNPGPDNLRRDISQSGSPLDPYKVSAAIDFSNPVAQTTDKFLSFSIDMSQVVGGKWWNPNAEKIESGSGTLPATPVDFENPNLIKMTRELSPAYLRVGGSESDKTFYDLASDNYFEGEAPGGYKSVLTKKRWSELVEFADSNGLDLIFTLNAGPGSRDEENNWLPDNSEELIKYSSENNYKISGWELGNEVNLYWYIHGIKHQVYPDQILNDLITAKKIIKKYYPDSMFLGQGSAFWPVIGEPLSLFFGITKEYINKSGMLLDIFTWHYYPQQSRRGPVASRRANPSRLLNPENLDEVTYWGNKIISWKNEINPDLPIWMGETGNAQFGGEPGISDKYIGGLWWLDQLGSLALLSHKVVIRQTLTGMNYGLINDKNYEPRPDFWNSYIWKKLMGTSVYRVNKNGRNSEKLRIYAHSTPSGKMGQYTVLAINLDHEKSAILSLQELNGYKYKIYSITTDDIFGEKIFLNNREMNLSDYEEVFNNVDYTKTDPAEIRINPLSYSFISIY